MTIPSAACITAAAWAGAATVYCLAVHVTSLAAVPAALWAAATAPALAACCWHPLPACELVWAM